MDESIITRMIQIGKVTAVEGTKARVIFGSGITSDWLPVLQRPDEVVVVTAAGNHSHDISCSGEGCDPSSADAGSHTHTAKVTTWVPKINDTVVVIFLPVFNSDGFVIGGI